jgi:hypothetical protein
MSRGRIPAVSPSSAAIGLRSGVPHLVRGVQPLARQVQQRMLKRAAHAGAADLTNNRRQTNRRRRFGCGKAMATVNLRSVGRMRNDRPRLLCASRHSACSPVSAVTGRGLAVGLGFSLPNGGSSNVDHVEDPVSRRRDCRAYGRRPHQQQAPQG